MRINRYVTVAISGCAIAAAAAIPAVAGAGHAAHPARPAGVNGTFHSTLTPKVAHPGTKMTLKATGAEHKKNYICIFAIVKGKAHNQDLFNTTTVKSSKKGTFHCSLTFHPFKETIAGKVRHCPLTKADKKAGVKCGFAAADPLNSTKSNTIQYFTARK
jgi:putative lipoic acid-binding regulatory protein